MFANKVQKHVCIVGLGHVGLPMACVLATADYIVAGVDIDNKVIERIKSPTFTDSEPRLQDLLLKAIRSGNLEVTTNVTPADIYVIAVPTLLNANNHPDISHVTSAMMAIRPHLRSGNLILIESTCPIGTTESIAQLLSPDIHVAYCPERILPGNTLHELIHNDRIVGGINETSTQLAAEFYRSFVRGNVLTTHSRMAEAVKLAENTYRDINIAYANELSMIAAHIDLDINELIHLANKHPRVQILNPGTGVGGYCIAVDPWFLVAAAPDIALLTSKAREINMQKSNWVIKKIMDTIEGHKSSVVACLGLTYKPDVSDIRNSPALDIVKALEKEIEVLRVDPYVPNTLTLTDALICADIIVVLVAHTEFLTIPSSLLVDKKVLDFTGVFK